MYCIVWVYQQILLKQKISKILVIINNNKLARFKKLLDNNKSAFWHKKQNCKIHDYVNPAYDTIYTYPIKKFQDNPEFWYDIIIEKDRSRIKQKTKEITAGHIDDSYDYCINTSDGKIKHLKTYITWDKDKDTGEWYYLGETTDVTELKH